MARLSTGRSPEVDPAERGRVRRQPDKSNKLKRAEEINAQQPSQIRIITEEEFCRMAGVPTPEALKRQYHAMRDLLARYRALREDHLRYLVKCGVIRPVLRTNADTFFAFPDLAAIKQANEGLSDGASFRSVVRALIASRQGQLAFDFRLDAAPAKILTLRPQTAARVVPVAGDVAPIPPRDTALAEDYFRAGSALDDGDESKREEAAAAYRKALECDPYLVAALINLANIHYSRDELAEGAGALRARDRPRVGFLRGALQPRQHLPRPRPLRRGAGLLQRGAEAQSVLRRRALLSGGDVREDGAAAGRAAALARVSAARAARRVGRAGERIFRVG